MDSSDEDSPEIESLDLSNDLHYRPLPSARIRGHIHEDYLDVPTYGSPTIRHSLPAYDLWRPCFPTILRLEGYRSFHRPLLRHYNNGPQALQNGRPKTIPIKNLARQIYRSQKHLRNRTIRAINSGMSRDEIVSKILSIRRAKDLTAKQGELFLFEYSEEHPPVLSQVGMASNVKIYVRPNTSGSTPNNATRPVLAKSNRENIGSPTRTSEASQESTKSDQFMPNRKSECSTGAREVLSSLKHPKPIYFSPLKPGTETMFIENNLYRAPIYPHQVDDCDFLVLRTRNGIYVRTFHKIFTVGQTMPLDVIPPPDDRAISKFRCDLSNLYIHKLFKETKNSRLDLDRLSKLFPDYHPSALRRRLSSNGAIHVGNNQYDVGTSNFGSKSLREDRSIIRPEQYCLNMSMLANQQRLRDLNYSESMILPAGNVALETEVLAAPWNTSKAISDTISGRCYLDLEQHLIDPTGSRREGFSCVSWVKSPTEEEQKCQRVNPSIKNNPTQLASIPPTNPLANKIKKEKLERLAIFQRKAQLISEVQSNVLSSQELLSEHEDSDESEDEDLLDSSMEQQVKDLDRMIVDGQTREQVNFENEEEERLKLMSTILNGSDDKSLDEGSKQTKSDGDIKQHKNKVLRIERTYENENGSREVRTELVREPQIIARYVQMMSNNKCRSSEIAKDTELSQSAEKTTGSSSINADRLNGSLRRRSLGPSELCRADGTTLIISKSVLSQNRRMRRSRNQSSFYT